ncbi:MAG: hypothetical protein AB1330_04300 [Bacillota bacterium]
MISKDMTILEIIEEHPETQEIFDFYSKRYATCISCGWLFSTVQETAAATGIPLESLLRDLETQVSKSGRVK